MWETVIQISLLALLTIYFGLEYYYSYWKRKHIPYVASNILDFEWYRLPKVEYFANIYRRLKGHKFGGFYEKFAPKLMICDPELIKHILIKDFEYFQDRGDVAFDENEPITTHMFSAPGPLWRKLRTKLTTTFTSGKMKYMYSLVEECAKDLTEVIGKRIEINSTIDVKEFSTRYTIEVISSCAFGLKAHTIRDGSSIFKVMATSIFSPNFMKRFVVSTRSVLPWLKKFFKISLVNKSVTNFFYKLTRDTVNYRKTEAVNRNDFLQLLINMKDDNEKEKETNQDRDNFVMTDELMTAQCFLFFIAGFDTSSMAISGALYELARNVDVQKKLRDEIDEYLRKNNDDVTYEMIKSMPYLDQVVSETLRKYPVLGVLNRVCVQRYKIPDTKIYIEKGTEVLIPVAGLHSDPKYFPNPEQFDPDRFKSTNNTFRKVYLPFGDGPRNCIGSRFAQMSVKLALVYLLRNFSFEPCPVTQSYLEFEPLKIVTTVKHEIFLKCLKK